MADSEGYLPPVCTNLKELQLSTFCGLLGTTYNRGSIKTFTPEVEYAIIALIQQNPSLISVTIESADITDETLLRIIVKELPNLQDLSVVSCLSPWTAKVLLEGLPESIQKVSLLVKPGDDRNRAMMQRFNNEEAAQSRNHHALKTLMILWMWSETATFPSEFQNEFENPTMPEENVLVPFLDTCGPALKHFIGYSTRLFCNERIRRAVGRTSIEWRHLSFSHVPESMISSDGDIAALIQAGSRWDAIDLDGYEEAGPLTQAAILEHAGHLRHLDISYIPSFSSVDMCTILGKCKSLVKFTAIDPMDPDPTVNPVISGTSLIQLDWASTSLTVWKCMITVPRPYGSEEEEDGQANNEMESHRIQRQVYQKLARQTRLRELRLGLLDGGQVPEHDSWYQTQCLEMTLASGMDELAELKNLEQLDVSYMMHKIGIIELEWMAVHWPKLKTVNGLFRSGHDPMPGVRQWTTMHRPYWVTTDDRQVLPRPTRSLSRLYPPAIGDLKDLIKAKKTNDFSDVDSNQLTLWRVTIPITEDDEIPILLNNVISDKKKLGPADDISDVFEVRPPKKTIHIIVQRPPQGIMDVIKKIQETFHPRRGSDSAPQVCRMMPLLERPMDTAIDRVVENVKACSSSQKDRQDAKSLSTFLVCSGTAGTGKTRYGQELYNTLRLHLSEKAKAKGVDYLPHHYYMLLDFSKDAMLRQSEASLDAETILGLRLAYSHFFQGKYGESFPDFCYRAVEHDGLFTISNVIIAIRKDLKLPEPEQQPFFLFLHIDEFQRIFDHRWEGTPKRRHPSLREAGIQLAGDKTERHTTEGLCLFKDMMHILGNFHEREVATRLDELYSITNFAKKHKELVLALVRLCVLQEPADRHLAPSDHFPALTLDVLERDTHTILEDSDDDDGRVLVRIPFFFLHHYNRVVKQVQNRLKKIFMQDWEEDRGWDFFEGIIAEYEALRTNLLLGDHETATLGDIYRGAMGRSETLGRIVKLKELSVVTIAHRFPDSGRPTVGGKQLDWRSGKVLKNAAGAPFAEDGIKKVDVITILITTLDVNDVTFKQLDESFPDNCLLIYKGNFTKFFGGAFSTSAALALSEDLNWNFATRETLKKKHKLGDEEVDQILENMPYRSYDDLVRKVPVMGDKDLDKEMGFLP
ncbi:hypothetical protein BG000_009916, partial [Podila horticola]